jgi:glycosyltransferase involved in cell wall biosynthesis
MPKVSVIIPTYNREGFIVEALESILAQTFYDFEIIIVDDGSTDHTGKIVQDFIDRYPETISYIYQSNRGAPATRNTGIRTSRGEFIAFLDSDDVWFPRKLEKCMRFLEDSGYGWVTTAAIRQDGSKREELRVSSDFLEDNGQKLALLKNGLYFFSSVLIIPSGVMIHKECFNKTGMFDESLKVGEDTDMWLRFAEAGIQAGYINEALFTYRVHSGTMTKIKASSSLEDHILIASKHAQILGMHRQLIRRTYAEFLWRCSDLFFEYGCYWRSIRCYLKSLWIYPTLGKLGNTFKILGLRMMQNFVNVIK